MGRESSETAYFLMEIFVMLISLFNFGGTAEVA
jgi:hypothetical protein